MKRLIVLAILLVPASYHALRGMVWLDQPSSYRSAAFERSGLAFSPPVGQNVARPGPDLSDTPNGIRVEAWDPVTAGRNTPAVVQGASEFHRPQGDVRVVESDLMATPDRAAADATRKLQREVSEWLYRAGVPSSWHVSRRLLEEMIRGARDEQVRTQYAVMHRRVYRADFSPVMRTKILDARDREIGGRRLVSLGAVLIFLLVGLAAVSGYIRADEATKGYYTNQLRLLAAAGIGVAGVAVYRMLLI